MGRGTNAIGGTRAEVPAQVLAQVCAIRSVVPPAAFPPLSPEQRAARQPLGLSQRLWATARPRGRSVA